MTFGTEERLGLVQENKSKSSSQDDDKHEVYDLFSFFCDLVRRNSHRSRCGQSVSLGSLRRSPQSAARGEPCRQPQSCCLEVKSSPPCWQLLLRPLKVRMDREKIIIFRREEKKDMVYFSMADRHYEFFIPTKRLSFE